MRLATAAQSKEVDRISQAHFHISENQLMEAAGNSAAEHLLQSLQLSNAVDGEGIAFLVGPGNNGGDALVMVRYLQQRQIPCHVFAVGPHQNRSPGFRSQWEKLGCPNFETLPEPGSRAADELLTRLAGFRALVDGIFGVGLNRSLDPELCAWIAAWNRLPVLRFSVDIPTGLNADTGNPQPVAFRADATCTFGLVKPGLLIREGQHFTGHLRCVDIGFPPKAVAEVARTHFALTRGVARRHLPQRTTLSHKASHGHVVVCAGGPGTWGAGVLCARAASRVGAGYITLAGSSAGTDLTDVLPEAMTSDWDPEKLDGRRAYAVGPGLGTGTQTENILAALEEKRVPRVVLDADALTVLARRPRRLPASWILTPHTGELARLLGTTAEAIEKNRWKALDTAVELYGCVILLKGFRSLVASGERRILILSGNSALAKGGSGDVLTGMISGMRAQGLSAIEAVSLGSFLHGFIADLWIQGHSDAALMPSDLLLEIDQAWTVLVGEKNANRVKRS